MYYKGRKVEIIWQDNEYAKIKYKSIGINTDFGRYLEVEFIHYEIIKLCILEKSQRNTERK